MHPLTAQLKHDLEQASNPPQASQMQAYMKTDQPFYGVKAPLRKKLFRSSVKQFPDMSLSEYEQVVRELWTGTHREQMYQALEVAQHYKRYCDLQAWRLVDELTHTSTWWDTLDWIASGIAGPIVLEHRALESTLVEWSHSDNLWVRRASLLAHLKYKHHTNIDLLRNTILKLCGEREFFIRKAIGWVLRDYAKTDAKWVQNFVKQHQARLSGLSKREALKHLEQ